MHVLELQATYVDTIGLIVHHISQLLLRILAVYFILVRAGVEEGIGSHPLRDIMRRRKLNFQSVGSFVGEFIGIAANLAISRLREESIHQPNKSIIEAASTFSIVV